VTVSMSLREMHAAVPYCTHFDEVAHSQLTLLFDDGADSQVAAAQPGKNKPSFNRRLQAREERWFQHEQVEQPGGDFAVWVRAAGGAWNQGLSFEAVLAGFQRIPAEMLAIDLRRLSLSGHRPTAVAETSGAAAAWTNIAQGEGPLQRMPYACLLAWMAGSMLTEHRCYLPHESRGGGRFAFANVALAVASGQVPVATAVPWLTGNVSAAKMLGRSGVNDSDLLRRDPTATTEEVPPALPCPSAGQHKRRGGLLLAPPEAT
jgi:hypothetical protein